MKFDFDGESAEVEQLVGRTRGEIAPLNYADHDYARVRLDEASTEAAITSVSRIADPLSRALVWSALDNAVRDGPPVRGTTAYARGLGKESHAGIMAGLSQTARSVSISGWRSGTSRPRSRACSVPRLMRWRRRSQGRMRRIWPISCSR
ncbi:hypothetical protein IOD13_13760 [Brevibacterium casei]|nr:hypothetical protein [Brevibacterium casei]